MLSTAHIEALRGPLKTIVMTQIGKPVDLSDVLRVISRGETVTVRQLHERLEISESCLWDCLAKLTKKGKLTMEQRFFSGSTRHFYTRKK